MFVGYHEWTAAKRSNLEKDLLYAEKYGFDYIELEIQKVDEYLKKHANEELKEKFRTIKLKPSALSAVVFFNLKQSEEFQLVKNEFTRQCKIANSIGCPVVVVVGSPNPERVSREEIKRDAVKCLRDFSDIARNYEIKVGCEFLGFPDNSINELDQCCEIVETTDKDNVGIVFDCFHFYANGSDIEDLNKVHPDKIYAFHINDSIDKPIGTLKDPDRVWPGDGVIPLEKILFALKTINFNGAAVVELFNEAYYCWEPEQTIKVAKEKTEKILKQFYYNL